VLVLQGQLREGPRAHGPRAQHHHDPHNSPHSYAFNPENAIPCESWFNDYDDTELNDLIAVFEQLAEPSVDDVMVALEKMKISAPVSLSTDEEEEDEESQSESYEESEDETGDDRQQEAEEDDADHSA